MKRIDFTHAFQPIINATNQHIFSYEALIRGKAGEGALFVLGKIPKEDLTDFICLSNSQALMFAAKLHLPCHLNLNFSPSSLNTNDTIDNMLTVIKNCHLNTEQLIVELTEVEIINYSGSFVNSIERLREEGIKIAIDDFGAGYSGLNLLVNFQPDIIKLDMHLIRNIHYLGPKQAVVRAIAEVCTALGIDVIAEGVETVEEFNWLKNEDIELFQGFLFATPGFEHFPLVNY